MYEQPKLLVRKTGLGLNTCIDLSGSHTNQVVFHYVPRVGAPAWAMHYVEGVLCSRVMLALHLSRTGEQNGDHTPMSHQKVHARLFRSCPLPRPRKQARAISSTVISLHEASAAEHPSHEMRVDNLVAGLYGLDDAGCEWVEQALAQTQALDAFAHLRTSSSIENPWGLMSYR